MERLVGNWRMLSLVELALWLWLIDASTSRAVSGKRDVSDCAPHFERRVVVNTRVLLRVTTVLGANTQLRPSK
jgi:hypothetical protein